MKIEMHEIPVRDVADGYVDSAEMARTAYERQKGVCPKCGRKFAIEEKEKSPCTPLLCFPLPLLFSVGVKMI